MIVDTSANDFVIYPFFHRNTFSGQHRLIHAGTTFHYDSVKWNSAARFNQNHLIYGNLRYRSFHLFSIAKNNRRIRSQLHKLSNGFRSLILTAAFHIFPKHNKCDYNRCGFIIEVMHTVRICRNGNGHHKAINKCASSTNSH